METNDTSNHENQYSEKAKKDFRHDLSVVFASGCLLAILLTFPSSVKALLRTLSPAITSIISSLRKIDISDAETVYKSFLDSDITSAVISLGSYFVMFGFPILFIKNLPYSTPKKFFPFKAKLPKSVFPFMLFSFGISISVNAIFSFLLKDLLPNTEPSGTSLISEIVSVLLTVVFASIGEELFFRCGIFQTLLPYSRTFAIFCSSFIFALAHRNPAQVVNAFVMGICLAIGFLKYNSVSICIMIHFINNTCSVILEHITFSPENKVLFWIICGIGICIAGFTLTMIIRFFITKRRKILVYNKSEYESGLPKLDSEVIVTSIMKNVFFWLFIMIITFETVVMYL